jgi:hypothetical protein
MYLPARVVINIVARGDEMKIVMIMLKSRTTTSMTGKRIAAVFSLRDKVDDGHWVDGSGIKNMPIAEANTKRYTS